MTARMLLSALAMALSAIVAAQQQPARDADVKPTMGTGSISGTVVTDEERPQPVRRAIVSLTGSDLRPARGAITDDSGRFSIAGLPAGRFTLTVSRPAFVTSVYGAKRPGRPGTAISVTDGQRVENVVVRLWRGAAIAGVLRDDTGAPVEGIVVTAIPARAGSTPGILTLSNNGTTTNEVGEYRIFGLEPGTYVVIARPASGGQGQVIALTDAEVDAALEAVRRRVNSGATSTTSPPPAPVNQARPFDYAPIYYPGTPVLANATQITLAPGQDQTGLDFGLQRVATSVVSGAVTRPDGAPGGGVTLQLTAVVPTGAFSSGSPLVLNTTSLPDGTFRINQVTPGEYRLVARAAADPKPPAPTVGVVRPGPVGPQLWATADLSISGTDVDGVTLALEPGITVAGSVRFVSETLKPPADLTRLRLTLVPPEVFGSKPGTSITTIAFAPPVNLRADGSFELVGVAPGKYRFLINGLEGTNWWPQSATIGGFDLFDRDVEITHAMSSDRLLVTYSDQHSELSGTLQTPAGAPVSDVVVIAFATDRSLWGSGARRVRAARPAVDGQFVMTQLAPGDYYLAALSDVDQDEWQEPGFLDKVITSAIKISISAGEKKVQNLRLGTQ